VGPTALIGRSVHSLPEARAAAAEGADFLIVGTIYPTSTHPGQVPEGPVLLEAVAAAVSLPYYAIGGITAANAAECLRFGAHGVAVIRAIGEADDPERAARELVTAIE
jgi:thiamine-phosphate diphosphorylase